MKNHFPERLEIFLALALKQTAKPNLSAANADFMLPSDLESETVDENVIEKFPALFDYLNEREAEKLQRVWAEYEQKSEAAKADWRSQIIEKIGTDESLIDERVHHSHINEILQREIPAVQKIIAANLPNSYRKSTDTFTGRKKKAGDTAELKLILNAENPATAKSKLSLEKTIRRAFAEQFVALRDLKKLTAFDRLSGTQSGAIDSFDWNSGSGDGVRSHRSSRIGRGVSADFFGGRRAGNRRAAKQFGGNIGNASGFCRKSRAGDPRN